VGGLPRKVSVACFLPRLRGAQANMLTVPPDHRPWGGRSDHASVHWYDHCGRWQVRQASQRSWFCRLIR
ncbi:MAG: hypothetical protein O2994_09335, partial [Proteobacteria bacterium]|nr:hypothetical protein [Pseudomonadota bacterium]